MSVGPERPAPCARAVPTLAHPPLDTHFPAHPGPFRLNRSAAGGGRFFVCGRRALVAGSLATGIESVHIDGAECVTSLALETGMGIGLTETAVGVDRRIRSDEATFVERIFTPRDLAAVVLEWEAAPGSTFWLAWTMPAIADRRERSGLLALTDRGAITGIYFPDPPQTWRVEETSAPDRRLHCRALLRSPEAGRIRIAIVGGRTEEEHHATSAALRPAPLIHARAALARRAAHDRLATQGPDPLSGQAVEWAKHRLDSLPPTAAPAEPFDATSAWIALARLASGDFTGAGQAIDGMRVRLADLDAPGGGTGESALLLLLTARHLAWTGEAGPIRERWSEIRALAEHCSGGGSDGPAALDSHVAALRAAALAELAIAAESIGEGAFAATLKTWAEVARRGWHTIVASGAEGSVLPLLLGLGDEARRRTDRSGPSPTDPWLPPGGKAWAAFARGESDEGFRLWIAELRDTIEGGGGGDLGPGRHGAPAAAILLPLVSGLLGAEPDSPRHRLRLRPQIPRGWDSFDAERIRMGEARVTLHCSREGERYRFRLVQETGGVPVRVIFEPLLPAPRLVAAWVDGKAAELDPRPFGSRMLVPVQVVLDTERVIELEVGAAPATESRELRVWRG